jgi:hypothetical protein
MLQKIWKKNQQEQQQQQQQQHKKKFQSYFVNMRRVNILSGEGEGRMGQERGERK